MSTTVFLGASVMAPVLAHSTTVMISPSNVYSLQGGVIDVRTADFSQYRGYRGPLRSVSASAFGASQSVPYAAPSGAPLSAMSDVSGLMRTTMPASTARSGAGVDVTSGGVRWSAGYFWGDLTLPPLSHLGEVSGESGDFGESGGSGDKPAASNEVNPGSRSGSPAGDEPNSGGGAEDDFSTAGIVPPSTPVDPPVVTPVVTPVAPVSTSTVSVPEPGSLGLMSAALLGLLAFRRRQIG